MYGNSYGTNSRPQSTNNPFQQPQPQSTNPFGEEEPSAPPQDNEYNHDEMFGGAYTGNAQVNPYEEVPVSSNQQRYSQPPNQQRYSQQPTQQQYAQQQQYEQPAGYDNNPFSAPSSADYAPIGDDSSAFGGPPPPNSNPNDIESSESLIGVPEKKEEGKRYWPWHLEFYQPLFNVDTMQVLQRILYTVTPWRPHFMTSIKQNPDLYGPFWMTSTVAFIIMVSANLHDYFVSDSTDWRYDVTKMIAAPSVMYGYVFFLPFVVWLVLKYIEAPVKLMEMICLYGYSMILFIPSTLVATFVPELFQWIAIIISASISGFFIIFNAFMPLKDKFLKRGIVFVLVLAGLHLGLTLTLLLYFFAPGKL